MEFLKCEIFLKKIKKSNKSEEFLKSNEYVSSSTEAKNVLSKTFNKITNDGYQSAGFFDILCCKELKESSDKPNAKVQGLGNTVSNSMENFCNRNNIN